jgi:hypothetical protein
MNTRRLQAIEQWEADNFGQLDNLPRPVRAVVFKIIDSVKLAISEMNYRRGLDMYRERALERSYEVRIHYDSSAIITRTFTREILDWITNGEHVAQASKIDYEGENCLIITLLDGAKWPKNTAKKLLRIQSDNGTSPTIMLHFREEGIEQKSTMI